MATNDQAQPKAAAPTHYVILHDTVGALGNKGEVLARSVVEKATVDLEWLLGLKAIAPSDAEGKVLPEAPETAADPEMPEPGEPGSAVNPVTLPTPDQQAAAVERATGADVQSTDQAALDAVNARARQALADAGYDTPEKLAAASDEDLLLVPGVGPATVQAIRGGTAE